MPTLDELNAADPEAFAAALDGVFEHAPFVAQQAVSLRPFATVEALHAALMDQVRQAPQERQRAFLCGHPELGDAPAAGLTRESRAEQDGLGLTMSLAAMNRVYRERFGIPFIVCAARHTAPDVERVLRARLEGDREGELRAAIDEIAHITRLRLIARVHGPGVPGVAGRLSCHVLDVAAGRAAAGVAAELWVEGVRVAEARTDEDGRIVGLLPAGPLRQGRYEFRFAAGAYFANKGVAGFYDVIPVAFVVSAADQHYHVPLLLAPFSYTTYRGS